MTATKTWRALLHESMAAVGDAPDNVTECFPPDEPTHKVSRAYAYPSENEPWDGCEDYYEEVINCRCLDMPAEEGPLFQGFVVMTRRYAYFPMYTGESYVPFVLYKPLAPK